MKITVLYHIIPIVNTEKKRKENEVSFQRWDFEGDTGISGSFIKEYILHIFISTDHVGIGMLNMLSSLFP